MTIHEAIRDRVRVVRLPEWEPGATLTLPLLPIGVDGVGPWATLHDVSGDMTIYLGVLLRDPEDRYEAAPDRQA